jgi:hypothetical protein
MKFEFFMHVRKCGVLRAGKAFWLAEDALPVCVAIFM